MAFDHGADLRADGRGSEQYAAHGVDLGREEGHPIHPHGLTREPTAGFDRIEEPAGRQPVDGIHDLLIRPPVERGHRVFERLRGGRDAPDLGPRIIDLGTHAFQGIEGAHGGLTLPAQGAEEVPDHWPTSAEKAASSLAMVSNFATRAASMCAE